MKIDVVMTEAIFRRFTFFDVLRRRKMWRSPMLFAAIMCGCAIVCFVMNHVDGAAFLGSTLAIVGLGMPLSYFLNFFFSVKKQVSTLGLKRPQTVYSLELTEAAKGIHISNGKEQADYAWKDVFHVYRDTTAIYLYMTPARAFLLPFPSLEGIEPDDLWQFIAKLAGPEKCTVL